MKVSNGETRTPETVVEVGGIPQVGVYGSALVWYDGEWGKIDLTEQPQKVPFPTGRRAFIWNNVFYVVDRDRRTCELRWYNGEHRSITVYDDLGTWHGGFWRVREDEGREVVEFFDWNGELKHKTFASLIVDADIHNGYAVLLDENLTITLEQIEGEDIKMTRVSFPEGQRDCDGCVAHRRVYYVIEGKLYRSQIRV